MKRMFSCLLTLLALLALAAPARADILWEPRDNRFYEQHGCAYEGRSYYANGPEGFVTAWDAPDGTAVRGQYENGEALWVGYTWQDWALISRSGEDGEETTGWIPREQLYLIYDHISFEEEHGAQFRDYNGEFSDFNGEVGSCIQLWEYPGAWSEKETLTLTQEFLDALRGTNEQPSYISRVYTDENGNNWGYVAYMYGIRNFWICLDNPESIMSSCIPLADSLIESGELTPPQEPVTPKMPARSYVPYILVAAVVILTALLLKKFWSKKEK